MTETNRREFLLWGGSALAGTALAGVAGAQPSTRPATAPSDTMSHIHLMTRLVPGAVDAQGNWQLPPLPYEYNALEPAIDEQTMRLHHDRHHQGYVNGLINAERKMAEARETGEYDLIEYWQLQASFHGGGHFLHCIFWESMAPNAGGEPEGMLAEHIVRDFGSFAAFKAHFGNASKKVEGSGWGILALQLASGRLIVSQGRNQNLLSQWGLVPLMCLDVWEHAYYLKYQNNRGAYVDNWWSVVDWMGIARRHALLHGHTDAA